MRIVPVSLKAANEMVAAIHRHHKPVQGHKFSIAVERADGTVAGVAIIGRPVARLNDDGLTLEVTRVATDGTLNACSMLYGAAARAAKALGYRRILTYTLASEPGTTLKASGWACEGPAGGGTWSRPSRQRTDQHPLEPKMRWSKTFI